MCTHFVVLSKKIGRLTAGTLLSVLGLCMLYAPVSLAAPAPGGGAPTNSGSSAVCEAIGSGADCDSNKTDSADINSTIGLVINILSMVVGVVAVIMIIISGFKYVTAAGDSNKVGNAKSTLVYALIGLVVVALAQLMVRFVLSRVTK